MHPYRHLKLQKGTTIDKRVGHGVQEGVSPVGKGDDASAISWRADSSFLRMSRSMRASTGVNASLVPSPLSIIKPLSVRSILNFCVIFFMMQPIMIRQRQEYTVGLLRFTYLAAWSRRE